MNTKKRQKKKNYLPCVLEFNKGEWRAAAILQIDKSDFAKFMEQILNVLCAYIWRQVTDVYSAFVTVTVRHDFCSVFIRFF